MFGCCKENRSSNALNVFISRFFFLFFFTFIHRVNGGESGCHTNIQTVCSKDGVYMRGEKKQTKDEISGMFDSQFVFVMHFLFGTVLLS